MEELHKAIQSIGYAGACLANTKDCFATDNGERLLKTADRIKQAVYAERARLNNTKIAKRILAGETSLQALKEMSEGCPCHMAIMIHQALYEGMYDIEDLKESAKWVIDLELSV